MLTTEELPKPIQEALSVLAIDWPFAYKAALLHFEGNNCAAISKNLGINYQATYKALGHAKKFLRKYVREAYYLSEE